MTKIVASLGALFLYGSLGAASAGGDIHHAPTDAGGPFEQATLAKTDLDEKVNGDESTPLASRSEESRPSPMGEMSPEEKERRRDVCVAKNEQCLNWCNRQRKMGPALRICREDCMDELGNCMKEIQD